MKRCSKCKFGKELNLFNKDKSSKDGHRSNCKECSRKYREENKDKQKEYRDSRKEKKSLEDKLWYSSNKELKGIRNKEYYKKKSDNIKKRSSEYYSNNRESKLEYQKEYQRNNKEKRNIQLLERSKNDPLYRLRVNIRNLINNSFYNIGYPKNGRTEEILGCSFEELKDYLESKFEPWMTWENRGIYDGGFNSGWDIDHIIPVSSAEYIEDVVKLNHYKNIQPLCSKINRDIKKDNMNYGEL